MYEITYNGLHLTFTENQQWESNDTFTVIAKDDTDKEYVVNYNAADNLTGDADSPDFVWDSPVAVEALDDDKPVNTVEIVSVWHDSRQKTPTYVLGAAWDDVTHYFTDYCCIERDEYILPKGYEVAEDQTGGHHIYDVNDSSWPCELFHHSSGRPAISSPNLKVAVLYPVVSK